MHQLLYLPLNPLKSVILGIRFMGETAKILNPEKRVLMLTLEATCSLDIGCPAIEFESFCNSHPDRTVVVYANTSLDEKTSLVVLKRYSEASVCL